MATAPCDVNGTELPVRATQDAIELLGGTLLRVARLSPRTSLARDLGQRSTPIVEPTPRRPPEAFGAGIGSHPRNRDKAGPTQPTPDRGEQALARELWMDGGRGVAYEARRSDPQWALASRADVSRSQDQSARIGHRPASAPRHTIDACLVL